MAETSASKLAKRIHTDGSTHYKSATAPANPVDGDLWYDTANELMKVYVDGSASFVKISTVTPIVSSISGDIVAGGATSLTLTGTGFETANLVVNFVQSSDAIDVDVTVTPTSATSATVAVPSSVYDNVTSGNAVTIEVTNEDNRTSTSGVTKTAISLPSGGTITTSGNYRYHKFTSNGTFTNTVAGLDVEYLLVGGGGGGGKGQVSGEGAGAGGAGGLLNGSSNNLSATTFSINVGTGAAGETTSGEVAPNGGNTTFNGLTALGGGGGDSYTDGGASGGSGGGGADNDPTSTGGSGTVGQGNDGGDGGVNSGGGGGGAGAAGSNGGNDIGGNGGAGSQYSTWATATSSGDSGYYAGGGGGGSNGNSDTDGTGGTGGSGGGGNGGAGNGSDGSNGTDGTGGGGGGGSAGSSAGGNGGDGGDGIAIIRYDLTDLTAGA
jgi:hypothetical protein